MHLHDGFYFRADLGAGYFSESATFKSAGVSADQSAHGGAGSMLLLFGGSPVDGFAIGGGLFFATAGSPRTSGSSNNVRGSLDSEMLGGFTGFGDYYFDPRGGFHVMGLVGYGDLSWNETNGTSSPSSEQPGGVMLGAGIGYDFWVADQWSIGVLGRVMYAPLSSTFTPVGTSDSVSYSSDVVVPVIAFTVLDH